MDAKDRIIIAADVTGQGSDCNQFKGQIEKNTESYPKEASADAGYYSESNIRFLMRKRIDAFIPPDKIMYSEWQEIKFVFKGRIVCDISSRA